MSGIPARKIANFNGVDPLLDEQIRNLVDAINSIRFSDVGGTLDHNDLANVTANEHHNQSHDNGDHAVTGTPGNSAVGDSAAQGSSASVARVDHKHGREGFGTVTPETSYGLSSADGTANTVSHSDHTHGSPGHDNHSNLTNLGSDSHTQYLLLAGRGGIQAIQGATSFDTIIDMTAANPPIKATKVALATSVTTWVGGTPSQNPSGYFKIKDEAGTVRYVPFWD